MRIKKAELKGHIEKKIKDRKESISDKIMETVKSTFKPIIYKKYEDIEPIEKCAQELHDALFGLVNNSSHDLNNKWVLQHVLRDIGNNVIGLRDSILDNAVFKGTRNLLHDDTNYLIEELAPALKALKEELAPKIKEYKDLNKLCDELLTVIGTSRSGDQAHKKLEELGVDLADFTPPCVNLPAVVKLTVNPCVLNGDCNN